MKFHAGAISICSVLQMLVAGIVSAQVLTYGPVVSAVTATGAKILVRSDQPAIVALQYGIDPNLQNSSVSDALSTSTGRDFTAIIPLASLAAGTTYYFDVLVNGVPQFSAPPYPSLTTFPSTATPAIYVSNYRDNTIQAFSLDGSNLGIFATLPRPTGLAFDTTGNLFVSRDKSSPYLIKEYAPNGAGSIFANSGLRAPHAVAFDRSGNLYVANAQGASIEKFTPDGVGTVFADSSSVYRPVGLVFDASGNLYVTNSYGGPSGTGSVTKLAPDGTASVFADRGFDVAYGLAIDGTGHIYVSNFGGNTIREFSPNGTDLGIFARTALDGPHGMIFDSSGNLYVANNGTASILKYSATGAYLGVFASTGDGPHFLALSVPTPTPAPTPGATPTPTPHEFP